MESLASLLPLVQNKRQKMHRRSHKKAKFTDEDDNLLRQAVDKHGVNNWLEVAKEMQGRSSRQCRERWRNYLDPRLSTEPWTNEEEELLIKLLSEHGPNWRDIAPHFPNRSSNLLKGRYTLLMKALSTLDPQANDDSTKAETKEKTNPEEKMVVGESDGNEQISSIVTFESIFGDSPEIELWGQMSLDFFSADIP